jgi:hypothetical protein
MGINSIPGEGDIHQILLRELDFVAIIRDVEQATQEVSAQFLQKALFPSQIQPR